MDDQATWAVARATEKLAFAVERLYGMLGAINENLSSLNMIAENTNALPAMAESLNYLGGCAQQIEECLLAVISTDAENVGSIRVGSFPLEKLAKCVGNDHQGHTYLLTGDVKDE